MIVFWCFLGGSFYPTGRIMYFIVPEVLFSLPVVSRYEVTFLWLGSSSVKRSDSSEQEVKWKQDVLVFTVSLYVCVLKLGVVKRWGLLIFEHGWRSLCFLFEKELRPLVFYHLCLYTGTHLDSWVQIILPGACLMVFPSLYCIHMFYKTNHLLICYFC